MRSSTKIRRSRVRKLRVHLAVLLIFVGTAAVADNDWWNSFYRDTIYPLALNVYHEARGESALGRQMVAYVTVERARENRREWGGNTIHGVVYHGCQFSWTCDPNIGAPRNAEAWEAAENAAILVALGLFNPPPVLEDARYYMNPDAASQRGRCWFAENLRQIGMVGRHYFYTEGEPRPMPVHFGCDADTPIV